MQCIRIHTTAATSSRAETARSYGDEHQNYICRSRLQQRAGIYLCVSFKVWSHSGKVQKRYKMRSRQIIVEIICALFVTLFTYAAVSKLMDYDKFILQLGQSPVLTAFSGIVVWLVPAVEVIISGLLMMKRFRLAGLYASYSLMVMFTAYIVVITRFSEYVPCSCGGVLEKLSWNQHLVFNIVFVLLAGAAIIIHPKDILLQWKQGNAENL